MHRGFRPLYDVEVPSSPLGIINPYAKEPRVALWKSATEPPRDGPRPKPVAISLIVLDPENIPGESLRVDLYDQSRFVFLSPEKAFDHLDNIVGREPYERLVEPLAFALR